MNETIEKKLCEIEQTENVRILIAVESGSRAWGFPSPDSDYDVRFIYVRPMKEYLRLDKRRDVIELPINNLLDINGWDLSKTLLLLHNSNPTLFEWFSSPILYRETEFADSFRAVMNRYFTKKKALYHYISMAESNYREYCTEDNVRIKKCFYVLRAVLACKWILDKETPPPMEFSKLADSMLDVYLKDTVNMLLDIKMNSPEVKRIQRLVLLGDYLEASIGDIKERISRIEDTNEESFDELNELFFSQLN